MATLPRITGALRAFSDIAFPVEYDENDEKTIIRARQFDKKTVSWSELKSALHAQKIDSSSSAKLTETIKELVHISREFVGSDSTHDEIECATVILFKTFKDVESVSQTESAKLRTAFGPFPATAASKACHIVNKLTSFLTGNTKLAIDNLLVAKSDSGKEFGKNIRFVSHSAFSIDDEVGLLKSEKNETISSKISFSFKYEKKDEAGQNDTSKTQKKTKQKKVVTSVHRDSSAWLPDQVRKYFHDDNNDLGLPVADICASLFELLCSAKTDNELQNDLFEFLGIDRLELIQVLLERRQTLLADVLSVKQDSSVSQQKQTKPAYGCQVTIQSEKEKQIAKQARKEEKKLVKVEMICNDEGQSFNPQQLRAYREIELAAAQRAPLLRERQTARYVESYPYVYDSYAVAKQSSAFVGGTKMVLPDGFERINNKDYEEVNIPAATTVPFISDFKHIKIVDLDDVAKIGFKGVKQLNVIQSIVFDTAYYSNENLLISAPTGAGKTNIAMLTILHEIKKHIEQGVIKKDDFKVVYVAPMKALAAEMVRNFGKRLEPLGIQVKELTGDMQLTKTEIMKTQMLVTTPEKWDVVTRKSTGDVLLTQLVKLLIIDEVHLLHDDRGAVLESLVARTLRQVESSQTMIRIVGLSATLPNYTDVATFLRVNPYKGLFFFDGRFRPVPLGQTFIGVKAANPIQQMHQMDDVCYEKVLQQVRDGHQVMVFVHARNATVRTATTLRDIAASKNTLHLFAPQQDPKFGLAEKQVMRSRNKQLRDLFQDGFSIHHAGMLRQDRNIVEKYFADGLIKVLVCTATLAWGINLPAHAVIIKGTQIYDAKHGTFIDIGVLDVMQVFGRAGRPQFDKYGHGTIISTHEKLSHYLSLLTRQNPIESQFISSLTDNLNAEIALGTVSNLQEAVEWLSYTYLYVRMRKNWLVYGITYHALQNDPQLTEHRMALVMSAARQLDLAHMIRFEESTGYLHSTDLGRIASHFYIKYATVEVINEGLRQAMTEADVLAMISKAQEFEQIKVRDDELEELDRLQVEACLLPVMGGSENAHGKVNILLQTHVSRARVESFSLTSDASYVAQNGSRIIRAVFEFCLTKGWPVMAGRLLTFSKVMDRKLWSFENPLRQFDQLSKEILSKVENRRLTIDKLREMDSKEIGHMIHHVRMGTEVKKFAYYLPQLELTASIQPITRTVLRVQLAVSANFRWNDRIHGNTSEPFWIWVEDPDNNHIYHSEYFLLPKKQVVKQEPQFLTFTIPIFEPLPSQYYIRAISDRWLGSESVEPISFQHLILPERHPPHTELLDLTPLPVSALNDPLLEVLYKYSHFNPIQTQIFHCLYHTDNNVLVGAPTGSGKTVGAELAIFRVFRNYPKAKAVYIAPLKAIVRERIDDWKIRFERTLYKKVVELTGDVTPDSHAIASADVIVTTPEKWDGISRSWQTRNYVKSVLLLVIDEIHLLGADRGPILEVIVSRTNFISSHTGQKVRIVGLSTALANARDLADWLGIQQMGLYNFRPSVRPVPLEVHIAGFPGKHYCPRMAVMNKPTYQAIKTHSPEKPTLIFVSSRRQTRVTALEMIAYLASEADPKQWLHMPDQEMEQVTHGIRDNNLKLMLAFGIGIHHAGLHERDRKTVEELFVNQKIQVLVATSTLAWGVNFPAHLVVVKGTEYFDGKTRRYVDFPITDVLQMMGRAGRPQYDQQGIAVILVHDIKKHFYKKFLYEPFPVESSLLDVLADHLNAEIVAGTISSKQDALDYLTWTYFFRRLLVNPSYYNLEDTSHDSVNRFLSSLVERAIVNLQYSYCIEVADDQRTITTQTLGRIASYYYLSHSTVRMFKESLSAEATLPSILEMLSDAQEFAELPVRHNEDTTNADLAKTLPIEVNAYSFDSSHTKTNLLLQAHFSRQRLPSADYHTDLKSVLDQAIRILQALLDVSADSGWLVAGLNVVHMVQMVVQGCWITSNPLLTLPHVEQYHLNCFRLKNAKLEALPEVMSTVCGKHNVLFNMLKDDMDPNQIDQIYQVLQHFPVLDVNMNIRGWWQNSQQQDEVSVPKEPSRSHVNQHWLPVHADQEYTLSVTLTRLNKKTDAKAHAPLFPKPKDEGWFLILGDVDSKELLALKRIGVLRNRTTVPLVFFTPETPRRAIYTLFIMSDSYVGLDQQYDVFLDVITASLEAQVNTELEDNSNSSVLQEVIVTSSHNLPLCPK